MRNQYFPQTSINVVVLDGQNDHVDALTVHQLDRLVQNRSKLWENRVKCKCTQRKVRVNLEKTVW